MKHVILEHICLCGLLLMGAIFCSIQAQEPQQPNVIVIFADDQGTLDLNCYGAKDLYTPYIDHLAAEGVRFTQFYAGAPVCSPSRASLMTGKNPHAAGLPSNASSLEGKPGMPTAQITMAEVFKQAGYATGHIGKWHMGYTPETMPNGQGFDYSFGHMGGCIDNYSHFFYWVDPNRHDLWENGQHIYEEGKYFPDLMVDRAQQFIRQHKQEPFFLYFAINLPHYPLQPTERWREHYADLPMPRRDYAAFVSVVDERVGQLMSTLDEYQLRENTIVVFMSDHGHSHESRTFGGGGYAGPYRGSKFSLFEGGIRVPAIISWPARLPKRKVIDDPFIAMDWLPTLADLSGIDKVPDDLDGQSMKSAILEDQPSHHEVLFWKQGRQWAVRKGAWKLIGNPRDPSKKFPLDPEQDALFLSNLSLDKSESANLASEYPQKVEALVKTYLEWEFAQAEDIPEILPQLESKAAGARVTLQSQPHQKYQGKGPATLVDNERGSMNFHDGRWMGFDKEDLEAYIELPEITEAQEVRIRCLQDVNNYIFLPQHLSVSFSEDGKNYSPAIQLTTASEIQQKSILIYEYHFPVGDKIKYVHVKIQNIQTPPDWHEGDGADAFLFVDEIIVE